MAAHLKEQQRLPGRDGHTALDRHVWAGLYGAGRVPARIGWSSSS